jgi:hypothetical protein
MAGMAWALEAATATPTVSTTKVVVVVAVTRPVQEGGIRTWEVGVGQQLGRSQAEACSHQYLMHSRAAVATETKKYYSDELFRTLEESGGPHARELLPADVPFPQFNSGRV